jgi:hypothetical protein
MNQSLSRRYALPCYFRQATVTCPPHIFRSGDWILRDYGLLYEKVDVYPGLPHGFWATVPQAEFTKAWKEDKKRAWSWLLSQSEQM